MAVILLDVEGRDNASGPIQGVTRGLSTLDQTMGRLAGSSSTVQRALQSQEASYLRLDSAQLRAQSGAAKLSTAQRNAATATQEYQRALASLNSPTNDLVGAQARLESAYNRTVSSQQRATQEALAYKQALLGISQAQLGVASAGSRVDSALNRPIREPSSGGGGGGGMGSSFAGQFLQYQVGYQLISSVQQAITQGFTRSLDTQRTLAMTQATTGITPSTYAALGQYVQQTAASGKQPFTSDVLATGLYAAPSAGVTDPQAIKAISDWAVKYSAFTGSPDTATASQAMVQTLSEQGIAPSQMAQMAPMIGDVITNVVNKGIVQPNQVAGNISTFGSIAAQFKVPFAEAAGVFTSLSLTAKSSDIGSLQTARLISSIGGPTQAQQKAANELGASDLLGPAGIRKFTTDFTGYMSELNRVTRLNPGADLMGIYGNRLSVAAASGLMGPGGANIGRSQDTVTAMGVRGSTQAASDLYNKTPAAQFDNSMAAFRTSVQHFSDAALPFATALTHIGTNGFNKLADIITNATTPNPKTGAGKAVILADAAGGGGTSRMFQQNAWWQSGLQALGLPGDLGIPGFLGGLGSGAKGIGSSVAGATGLADAAHSLLADISTVRDVVGGVHPAQTARAAATGGRTFSGTAPFLPAQPVTSSGPLAQGATLPVGTVGIDTNNLGHALWMAQQRGGTADYQQNAQIAQAAAYSRWAVGNIGQDAAQAQRQAAYDLAHSGGAHKTAYQDAQLGLQLSMDQGQTGAQVASRLGTFEQALRNSTLSGDQQAQMRLAAESVVSTYNRAPLLAADQDRIGQRQMALDLATQGGQDPKKLQALYDSQIASQRQLAQDTYTTRQQQPQLAATLRGLTQQQTVQDYAYTRAGTMDTDQNAITAAQQNLEAAQVMSKVPSAWKTQEDAYFASLRQFYRDTLTGRKLDVALQGVNNQQLSYGKVSDLYGITTQERTLQNQIQIDTIHGNLTAARKDRAALLAYDTVQAGPLGKSPSDLALQAAQNWQANMATLTPIPKPFQANQAGLGAFGGQDMTTTVRLGGPARDPQAETIKRLEAQIAKDNEMIALLQQLVNQGNRGNTARQGSAGGLPIRAHGH